MAFREITPEEIRDNMFVTFNKEWMLLTAGDEKAHNTMTVSWGSTGELWGHYTATVHVRPQRYTLPFIEKNGYFSLCVLPKDKHDAMVVCGRTSGRGWRQRPERPGLHRYLPKRHRIIRKPGWC